MCCCGSAYHIIPVSLLVPKVCVVHYLWTCRFCWRQLTHPFARQSRAVRVRRIDENCRYVPCRSNIYKLCDVYILVHKPTLFCLSDIPKFSRLCNADDSFRRRVGPRLPLAPPLPPTSDKEQRVLFRCPTPAAAAATGRRFLRRSRAERPA